MRRILGACPSNPARLLAAWLCLPLIAACGAPAPQGNLGEGDGSVTVYSGRSERLIAPLLERFTERTGIAVKARYGSSSALVATLMEEGANTPAAVFISQDAAALGALSGAGMLRGLPQTLLQRVPERFRAARGNWVGLSGRARVVVYNTDRIAPDQLPQSLEEVTHRRYRGRFGIAPTNASYQAHMALVYALGGEESLARLLAGIAENKPVRYGKNSRIVQAVIAGEIDWGLVNHYYLWRALKEDPDAPARNFFMPGGEASGFVNMAGAGLLDEDPDALRLLEFLLGEEAQRYFAEETFEYPLAADIPAVDGLPALEELLTPDVDYQDVAVALERTLAMISDAGLTTFQ